MADTPSIQLTQEHLDALFARSSGQYNLGPVSILWQQPAGMPPPPPFVLDVTVLLLGNKVGAGTLTTGAPTMSVASHLGLMPVTVALALLPDSQIVDVHVNFVFKTYTGQFSF